MCPVGGRLVNETASMVCHCLLIESNSGLILVDTGFGEGQVKKSKEKFDSMFRKIVRPKLNPTETALSQIKKLGFKQADVQHIVLTHLDMDHAGGIPDFPQAKVHVYQDELQAAQHPKSFLEKKRYHSYLWKHNPHWETYKTSGEKWEGFDCVKQMKELPPEILMVPLVGHTSGHCGIAVQTTVGWMLHSGDAYFYHDEVKSGESTFGLSLFQTLLAEDNKKRVENQKRLRELSNKKAEVKVFSAHDPSEFSFFN